jgi:hypothetical protein
MGALMLHTHKREKMSDRFLDFPCGSRCEAECEIRTKMIGLQQSLEPSPVDRSADLVRAFFASYRALCQSSPGVKDRFTPDVALPALFDLVVSAKYAERMTSSGGWVYCAGAAMNQEGPALYFPFLNTCPRCSVKRGIRPLAKSNKPASDPIGTIAGDATIMILSELIRWIAPDVKVTKSSNRRGDVDTVIYDEKLVALGEIKSSPLVVYPLETTLTQPMTEVREGISVPKRDHSPATVDLDRVELSLYVPHIDLRIPLGRRNGVNWPYSALIEFANDPQNLALLVSAWKELYDVYAAEHKGRGGQRGDIDNRRWLTCGCGGKIDGSRSKRVDDSKNAPGMDRTDDIKKGTYQVLKFGTYYKEKCPRRILRAVLISNFLPLHKFDGYLSEMQDVLWTKEKYSVSLSGDPVPKDVMAFQTDSVFNLYDALLCLTRSIYRDERLREISSIDEFVDRFCA